MEYFNAFWVGGLICVAGQLLIDLTRLTPARIMVLFVTGGVVLGAWLGAVRGRPQGGGGERPFRGVHRRVDRWSRRHRRCYFLWVSGGAGGQAWG